MDALRAEGCSSSPILISPQSVHDVFVSFKAVDTRKNFTSHLFAALEYNGFRTFMDDNLFERGEFFSDGLLKAIEGSRISLIVFSKGYFESKWCLDELVKIMDCMETFKQIVLPIFYHVAPSDVRKQTGILQDAFANHKKRLREEPDGKEEKWRAALTKAGNLSGLHLLNDGDEAILIQEIIKVVEISLSRPSLNSTALVGSWNIAGECSAIFQLALAKARKLVAISPLFSRPELLHVWPGLNFWYYLAIISSPAWVFSFLAMDFIKKTTYLVFIFLISTLALLCFAINFMLSQFYFSLPSIPETDRFFRGYQRGGKTIGYTLLFFSNVGLYYFTEKSVACMLTFLFLAFYCLCALFCIQPYTDFGALEFLLNMCMNQILSLFGLRSSYSWLVIIYCIVITGIRFCLEPAEATTDEVDLESGRQNT